MKLTINRRFADTDKAARRLMQHAHAFEPIQDGRIYIEKLNGPFLFGDKGTPEEYAAGSTARLRSAGLNCMTAAHSRSSPKLGQTSFPSIHAQAGPLCLRVSRGKVPLNASARSLSSCASTSSMVKPGPIYKKSRQPPAHPTTSLRRHILQRCRIGSFPFSSGSILSSFIVDCNRCR
jgi:hypothetical protein